MLRETSPGVEIAAAMRGEYPKCAGLEAMYVDYDRPPSAPEAMEMCSGCPIMDQCKAYARDVKPKWGVWHGIVYGLHGVSKKSEKLLDTRESNM